MAQLGGYLPTNMCGAFALIPGATETERCGARLGKRPKGREFKVVLSCRALLSNSLLSLPEFHA